MLGGRWRIDAGNGHLEWGGGLPGALGAFVLTDSRGAVALDVAAVDVRRVFCFLLVGKPLQSWQTGW